MPFFLQDPQPFKQSNETLNNLMAAIRPQDPSGPHRYRRAVAFASIAPSYICWDLTATTLAFQPGNSLNPEIPKD